jgi:hypothetical protein
MGTLPDESVNTLDGKKRASILTTGITVMDERFLKQRIQLIDDQMMHHPITKVGGKYFSLNRLIDNKGSRFARLVTAIIDFSAQLRTALSYRRIGVFPA